MVSGPPDRPIASPVCRRSRGTRSARDEPQSRGGSGAYPSLALLLESVGELGREQLAIDLAVGIARQSLALLDAKRDHVLRQVLSAMLEKRLAIKPRAGGVATRMMPCPKRGCGTPRAATAPTRPVE